MNKPAIAPAYDNTAIDIRPVQSPADRKAFIRLSAGIYKGDPNFIAPLEFEIGARLDPNKNPAIKNSPHKLWIRQAAGSSLRECRK
jgi:hypothetical protein